MYAKNIFWKTTYLCYNKICEGFRQLKTWKKVCWEGKEEDLKELIKDYSRLSEDNFDVPKISKQTFYSFLDIQFWVLIWWTLPSE